MRVGKKGILRIWGDCGLRMFISHTNSCKDQAAELRSELGKLGVSAFVAHENIEPNKQWQKEIRRALFTMDMLVALLTEDFTRSKWTDQEVGVAVGREVPVVSVRLGADPYGFIGNVQAISGSESPDQWTKTLCEITFDHTELRSKATDAFILAISNVSRFSEADDLFKMCLPRIRSLSSRQHAELVAAFNDNDQVYGAFNYNRRTNVPAELKRIMDMPHFYLDGKLAYEPF